MRNFVQILSVLALLHVFSVPVSAAPAVEISECGQVVESRSAVLVADLDCGPSEGGIVMQRGGRVELAGFSINVLPSGGSAIRCHGPCKVIGPGTVTGGTDTIGASRRLKVIGVTVTGAVRDGVESDQVVVKDCLIADNGTDGVDGHRKAKVIDSVVTGNGRNGIYTGDPSGRIKVKNSDVTGNAVSVLACGDPAECADLSSAVEPRVKNTQCGDWYDWASDSYTDLCAPN